MAIKEIIIKLFPSIYIKKNFSELNNVSFKNYRQKNIEPELLLLPYLIKKENAFIDIGSNKGLFLFLSQKFLNANQIIGFEPNPILFNKIKNVFKNIKIFNVALANKNGEAILSIPYTKDQPDDSLGNLNNTEVSGNAFNFKVTVKKLDDHLKEFPVNNIGLIKIDVEGHEMDVISGVEETLKKQSPNLIVEIEQRHHKEKIEDLLKEISNKFNYKVFYFLPEKNKMISFSEEPIVHQQTKDFGTINYVNNFIFIGTNNDPDNLISKINSDIENLQK